MMTKMKLNKFEKCLLDCYIDAYKAATPSADFLELIDKAATLPDGRKEINFMDYECKKEDMEKILKNNAKKHKLTKRDLTRLEINFYLGCSPKTAKEIVIDDTLDG